MKKENKIITLVIVALVFAVTFGLTLVTYLNDGKKLKGDIDDGANNNGLNSTATASTYKNWNQLETIDNNYSYSTLFYTADTEFYFNSTELNNPESVYYRNNDITEIAPYMGLYTQGGNMQIIITNCATDSKGNKLSAVLDVTAADIWDLYTSSETTKPYVWVGINNAINVNKSQTNPVVVRHENADSYELHENMPIMFNLSTLAATARVKLTYYKNLVLNKDSSKDKKNVPYGTDSTPNATLKYATVNTTSSTVATDINKVNTFYTDIDIPRSYNHKTSTGEKGDKFTDKIFEGREGVAPLNGRTTIYYAKGGVSFNNPETNNPNSTLPGEGEEDVNYIAPNPGKTSVVLREADNGVFIKYNDVWRIFYKNGESSGPRSEQHNIDGIWYGQSTEFLTENVNGAFEFTYSGSENGIGFMFISPRGYTPVDPVKSVNKVQVTPGEEFNFEVKQYIPNNYFSNIVNFSSVFNNYPSNNFLTKLTFEDVIDDRLTIQNSGITIKDINGNDLTQYYDINVNGQTITTTEKSTAAAYYQTVGAYNNYYILKVPVKYNGTVTDEITIPNVGKTTIRIGDGEEETKITNEVTVKIVPKVIKLTYDCKTNGGNEENYTINMKAGDDVDLSRLCTKSNNSFKGWVKVSTETKPMTSFTMPDVDTTIYGIYEPITCDLLLKSSVYQIDQTNKTVSVPIDDKDADIIKNVTSKGEVSILGDKIIVKCAGEQQPYKINRFWINKTGNPLIKWTMIISGIALVAVLGIIVRVVMVKKEKNSVK